MLSKKILISRRAERNFSKSLKRKKRERKRKAGFKRHLSLLKKNSKKYNFDFDKPKYQRKISTLFVKRPDYDDVINFLIPKYKQFCSLEIPDNENGILEVPSIFSISENYQETMFFLKRLFHILYKQQIQHIVIDYKECVNLDVDASAFMDIILMHFINYYDKCSRRGHKIQTQLIDVNNISNPNIYKVLFSIGAYKNIKGLELERDHETDFIPFTLRIGDSLSDKNGIRKEIHETEIVDYVINCLEESGHTLTPESETHLSKVVGEVMANAEEHSKFRYRYAIGYFIKPTVNNHLGVFKLTIFNFGQTIYESFKNVESDNSKTIRQMRALSYIYTKKGFFKPAKYEEQTLWTLYALQEGVTSVKNWKRGKGTIRFIDRFFKLKGDCEDDNLSKLTLISGNTHIIFDGKYPLVEVEKNNNKFQMMTLNNSGNILQQPDDKFITFVPHYFPGTLISAKIHINDTNVEGI